MYRHEARHKNRQEMKMESHKEKTRSAAMVLLAVAALLGALVLYEVAECLMTVAQAELAVVRASEAAMGVPNDVNAPLAEAKSTAEALKKNNLFVRPLPKQNPIREVLGILGDEALINGKWYKAGDTVGEAKILAVEPTKIKVSWKGQKIELTPLGAKGGGPSSEPPRPGRIRPAGPVPGGERGPRRMPPDGPGAVSMQKRVERRNRFREASPEEWEKMREQMRERFGVPRR